MPNEIANYGYLSRQLTEGANRAAANAFVFSAGSIRSIAGEVGRLERIVSALESIGVNLDETDVEALERIVSAGEYSGYASQIRDEINTSIASVLEESREREQEQATEALAAAGFVVDDEDGETWTRDDVTVKIECAHPAESTYRWEYMPRAGYGLNDQFGKSGDFHRLMALIGGAK